jgi:hypothetical protein
MAAAAADARETEPETEPVTEKTKCAAQVAAHFCVAGRQSLQPSPNLSGGVALTSTAMSEHQAASAGIRAALTPRSEGHVG